MPDQYSVLTTRAFERDFRKASKGSAVLVGALEELLGVLRNDPHNRTGQHNIKKLAGLKPGEG